MNAPMRSALTAAKPWRVWSGVGVVFLCGLLLGTVATTIYDNYKTQQKWEQGLAGLKKRVMKHLTQELRLSAEQQRTIDPIIRQAEGELLRLRIAQQPQVDATVAKTIEAVKTKLTPEQQSKMDELYRRLQRRWDSDRDYVRGLP
jgi:hypothetical protein